MKKLLALVLCVMMFVAVVPTSAFAAYTEPPFDGLEPDMSVAKYTAVNKALWDAKADAAVTAARAAIEKVYQQVAVNDAAVAVATKMDSTIESVFASLAIMANLDPAKSKEGGVYMQDAKNRMGALVKKNYDAEIAFYDAPIPVDKLNVFADSIAYAFDVAASFVPEYEAVYVQGYKDAFKAATAAETAWWYSVGTAVNAMWAEYGAGNLPTDIILIP